MKSRKQVYIVINNKTVWKHIFFMKKEQALPAVKKFYGGRYVWEQVSENAIKCREVMSAGKTFTVIPIKEYTGIGDIPYSPTTQSIKGEKHK